MTRSVSCHLPLREGPQSSGRCWPCPRGTSTSGCGRRLLDGTDTFRVPKGKHSVSLSFEESQRLLRLGVGGHLSPHTLALRGAEDVEPCALQRGFQG